MSFFLAKKSVLVYNFVMRIVAGKYRGKKLKEFDLETTRPTMDMVKESIFNLIQFDVLGAVVLDLFAGTGALGVEAISRGAKHVEFVDNNPRAIKIVKENLAGIVGDYKINQTEFEVYLNFVNLKFDIVLLDPPFSSDFGERAINKIIERKLLAENGIIIFETSAKKDFEFSHPGFNVVKKKYGSVAVYKIEKF